MRERGESSVPRIFLEAAGDRALRGGAVAGPQLGVSERRQKTDVARASRRRPLKPGDAGGRLVQTKRESANARGARREVCFVRHECVVVAS